MVDLLNKRLLKTLKVRLYPNEDQRVLLEKHFGTCRFVWNHFLEVRTKYYAEHKDDKGPPPLRDLKDADRD
ncbi:MAG: helix-turn-helix domain-containing protein [Thermoprotei archaeon]